MERKQTTYERATFQDLKAGIFFKKLGDPMQRVFRKKNEGYGRDILLQLDIPFHPETPVIIFNFCHNQADCGACSSPEAVNHPTPI
jgi:hypothetical protein